ncbi:MAG TPA: AmmeMemoRadiSam system radical SAM enzyme [Spirochaetota bacterium]|nr:AmmeMemoRadiSam system radical SAM enzyme [Spirochaetota bacterium]HOM38978.1 AmmeMemoRadiSam system radical SAM enzyme [Spirochaetota bacterium]HPQ48362.1 AmmeMemoRadiSam system radical SAM enzyme [Spirochaetota bacterium]
MKEALFYEKLNDNVVKCILCPHFCVLKSGDCGFCLNRKNIDGKLYSLNYGVVSSVNIDPIEKKPLYHFYPGSQIFSVGTFGCSLNCQFCQNYTIARNKASKEKYGEITPSKIIELAKTYSDMIAYTYNEPYIWYEFLIETVELARKESIKNVLVTNGYYNKEPWEKLSYYIDAMNIDLKGDSEFYKRLCSGDIDPVLQTIESAFNKGIHVEVTYLVLTAENEDPYIFSEILKRVSVISRLIPFHISRYFPSYKFDAPPTNIKKMEEFYLIASKEMEYVYLGNVLEHNNTVCPKCGKLLIERRGYHVKIIDNFKGRCSCGYKFYGMF